MLGVPEQHNPRTGRADVRIHEDDYSRVIAVGDLHGHREPFHELLELIDLRLTDCLIFMGDYIDRGPSSKSLVQELVDLRFSHKSISFLKGNHEDMLLGCIGYPAIVDDLHTWLYNGGSATLLSYGLGEKQIGGLLSTMNDGEIAASIRSALPAAHLDFYLNLEPFVEGDHFFFCHAGLDPRAGIEEGKRSMHDLLWMREHLYAENPSWEKTVVCGHTPLENPLIRPKLICIDTGLHYFGKLTALDVLSMEMYQVG
jgi:serine/threonine protein phosphatase 1